MGTVLRGVFPLVEYCLNQEYISEVLCINKDKKELSCNGKCYLMNRITEEEKKDSNSEINNIKLEVHFSPITEYIFEASSGEEIQNQIIYENNYFHLLNKGLFRPPKAC